MTRETAATPASEKVKVEAPRDDSRTARNALRGQKRPVQRDFEVTWAR